MGAGELVGVALGGVLAGCGALVSHIYSQRGTHRQWLRDSRLAAQSALLTAVEAGYVVAVYEKNDKERAASVTAIRGAYAKVRLLGPEDVSSAAAEMTHRLLRLVYTEGDLKRITQEAVNEYNQSRDSFCSLAYRHISQPNRTPKRRRVPGANPAHSAG